MIIISIDGNDGVGKDTIIELTISMLVSHGKSAKMIKNPISQLSSIHRRALHPKESSFLFYVGCNFISYSLAIEKQNLDAVFLNRSHISTLAAHSIICPEILDHYKLTESDFPQADLKVWIRTDETVRHSRILKRSSLSKSDKSSLTPQISTSLNRSFADFSMIEIWNNSTPDTAAKKLTTLVLEKIASQ